eukprot:COSAG02_NODE_36638_length_452_cov_0.878187_1_plen_20_part_01
MVVRMIQVRLKLRHMVGDIV